MNTKNTISNLLLQGQSVSEKEMNFEEPLTAESQQAQVNAHMKQELEEDVADSQSQKTKGPQGTKQKKNKSLNEQQKDKDKKSSEETVDSNVEKLETLVKTIDQLQKLKTKIIQKSQNPREPKKHVILTEQKKKREGTKSRGRNQIITPIKVTMRTKSKSAGNSAERKREKLVQLGNLAKFVMDKQTPVKPEKSVQGSLDKKMVKIANMEKNGIHVSIISSGQNSQEVDANGDLLTYANPNTQVYTQMLSQEKNIGSQRKDVLVVPMDTNVIQTKEQKKYIQELQENFNVNVVDLTKSVVEEIQDIFDEEQFQFRGQDSQDHLIDSNLYQQNNSITNQSLSSQNLIKKFNISAVPIFELEKFENQKFEKYEEIKVGPNEQATVQNSIQNETPQQRKIRMAQNYDLSNAQDIQTSKGIQNSIFKETFSYNTRAQSQERMQQKVSKQIIPNVSQISSIQNQNTNSQKPNKKGKGGTKKQKQFTVIDKDFHTYNAKVQTYEQEVNVSTQSSSFISSHQQQLQVEAQERLKKKAIEQETVIEELDEDENQINSSSFKKHKRTVDDPDDASHYDGQRPRLYNKTQEKQQQKEQKLYNSYSAKQIMKSIPNQEEARLISQLNRRVDAAKIIFKAEMTKRNATMKANDEVERNKIISYLDDLRTYVNRPTKNQDLKTHAVQFDITEEQAKEAQNADSFAIKDWIQSIISSQGQFSFVTFAESSTDVKGKKAKKAPTKFQNVDLSYCLNMDYIQLVRFENFYHKFTDIFNNLSETEASRDEKLNLYKSQYQIGYGQDIELSTYKKWWRVKPINSSEYKTETDIKIPSSLLNRNFQDMKAQKGAANHKAIIGKTTIIKQTFDEIIQEADIQKIIQTNSGRTIVNFQKNINEIFATQNRKLPISADENEKIIIMGRHLVYAKDYKDYEVANLVPAIVSTTRSNAVGPLPLMISDAELKMLKEDQSTVHNRTKENHFILEKMLNAMLVMGTNSMMNDEDAFEQIEKAIVNEAKCFDLNNETQVLTFTADEEPFNLQRAQIKNYEQFMKFIRAQLVRYDKPMIEKLFEHLALFYVKTFEDITDYYWNETRNTVRMPFGNVKDPGEMKNFLGRYLDTIGSYEKDGFLTIIVISMLRSIAYTIVEMALVQKFNQNLKAAGIINSNTLCQQYINEVFDKNLFCPSQKQLRSLYYPYEHVDPKSQEPQIRTWANKRHFKINHKMMKHSEEELTLERRAAATFKIDQMFDQMKVEETKLVASMSSGVDTRANHMKNINAFLQEAILETQNYANESRTLADFSQKHPLRPKELYVEGKLWFLRVQGILYGNTDNRVPNLEVNQAENITMQNLKDAYNMLKIDMANLRAIRHVILYMSESMILNAMARNPIQLHEITIAALLSEFVNIEKNREDAHYEEFETIVNMLLVDMSETKKKQALKATINEIQRLHIQLKDPIFKSVETDVYSLHFATHLIVVRQNLTTIMKEVEEVVEQKYNYTGYVDTASIMQETKKLTSNIEKNKNTQKLKKLLTAKNRLTIKIGDIANRKKLEEIKLEEIVKETTRYTQYKTMEYAQEGLIIPDMQYKIEVGSMNLEEQVNGILDNIRESTLKSMIAKQTIKKRAHQVGQNDINTTVYSLCTEKVYFHASETESVYGVKDSNGNPIPKFIKWSRELSQAVIVLSDCGINGLKVYLARVGICTKSLVSDLGCLDINCQFIHEPRDFITLMIKEYCQKYVMSNVSESMEQFYCNAIKKQEENVYTYIGAAKTIRKIKGEIEKARAIKMSDDESGDLPPWTDKFKVNEDLYGFSFEQIQSDFSRSILGQSEVHNADNMMSKLAAVVYSNLEYRECMFNHAGAGWKNQIKSQKAEARQQQYQKDNEKKNIFEYLVQCNMAKMMPALLFGLGLYCYELRPYMDTKMAGNEDQNIYAHKETREILIQLLYKEMSQRYNELVKAIKDKVDSTTTIHANSTNFLSWDFSQLHGAIMNFYVSSLGGVLIELFERMFITPARIINGVPKRVIPLANSLNGGIHIESINHFTLSVFKLLSFSSDPAKFIQIQNQWAHDYIRVLQRRTKAYMDLAASEGIQYEGTRRMELFQKIDIKAGVDTIQMCDIAYADIRNEGIFYDGVLDPKFDISIIPFWCIQGGSDGKIVVNENAPNFPNGFAPRQSLLNIVDAYIRYKSKEQEYRQFIFIDQEIQKSWKFILDNIFICTMKPASPQQTAILRENWLYDDTHYRNKAGGYSKLITPVKILMDDRNNHFKKQRGYKNNGSSNNVGIKFGRTFNWLSYITDRDEFRIQEVNDVLQLASNLQSTRNLATVIFNDSGPEYKEALRDTQIDPIRNSLKKFTAEDPELEKELNKVGMIICQTGLSKYEKQDLLKMADEEPGYTKENKKKNLRYTFDQMIKRILTVMKLMNLGKLTNIQSMDEKEEELSQMNEQEWIEFTAKVYAIVKKCEEQKDEVEQILDAVSVFISTELVRKKLDLTQQQHTLLNSQINGRLERKMKTIIGYRVTYYTDKDGISTRINVEKILQRIGYAIKHRALYKQLFDLGPGAFKNQLLLENPTTKAVSTRKLSDIDIQNLNSFNDTVLVQLGSIDYYLYHHATQYFKIDIEIQ